MTNNASAKHRAIHKFLKGHPMGILSTVDSDGSPWGAAIYYVVDKDFKFYFVTRAETYKYQNLDKNPFAALTIADSGTQTTVQLSGKVSPLPVKQYMEVFFDKFAKIKPKDDHSWMPPLSKIHQGNYMPLKLTPAKMQYADYGHRKDDPKASYIDQIIPAQ